MKLKIPMQCPEDLPRQRLPLVVELPARPDRFLSVADQAEPLDLNVRPRVMPRSARYLCMLEWAWSPNNNRVSAYHLSTNRQRSLWLLWHSAYSDDWDWSTSLSAYAPKAGISERTGAVHLLIDSLKRDSQASGLDWFDWIAQTGELGVPDIVAIGSKVWR